MLILEIAAGTAIGIILAYVVIRHWEGIGHAIERVFTAAVYAIGAAAGVGAISALLILFYQAYPDLLIPLAVASVFVAVCGSAVCLFNGEKSIRKKREPTSQSQTGDA